MTPPRKGHPAPAPFRLGPALGRNKPPRFQYFYIKNIHYLLLQTSSVVTETRHTHHIKLLGVVVVGRLVPCTPGPPIRDPKDLGVGGRQPVSLCSPRVTEGWSVE